MFSSRSGLAGLRSGLLLSCIVGFLPIALRVGVLWTGPTTAWAFALPAYLPAGLAVASLAVPIALVCTIIALGYSTHPGGPGTSSVRRALGLAPLLAIPALVWALPDLTGFMGDYLFRQGAILAGNYPASFPQSLPLDRLVQGSLVPMLGVRPQAGGLPAARWMGLVACLAMTLLSVRALRRKQLNGWSCLAIVVLAGGGYLCIFTGYARDWVELLPLTLLLLVTLLDRVRAGGRLSPAPELALSAILLLHRSAICLFPAYLIATGARLWPGQIQSPRHRFWGAGVALLSMVALSVGPRYVTIISAFDLPLHAPWLTSIAAPRPPVLDAHSMWDVLNALSLLSPAAPLAWLGIVALRDAHERWFMLGALAGWLPPVLLLRPQQGAFRDYDVYAGLALTLSFAAAVGLHRLIERGHSLARVCMAIAACSTLQASFGLLLVANSPTATEARVRHGLQLSEPGLTGERAGMNDFLGLQAEGRLDWLAASGYFSAASELAPSQVRLVRAGRSAAFARDWQSARKHFGEIIARDSTSTIGWCGYAATSARFDDTLETRRAEVRLLQLCRSRVRWAVALRFLSYAPALDTSGVLRQRILSTR